MIIRVARLDLDHAISRSNRFSARQCGALTRYMLAAFPAWDEGLPIGCVDGTIRRRFCGAAGEKEVHAKTGSLRIAVALSGYINNLHDDQRCLFSFIANRTNIDQTATRQAIDNSVVLVGGPFRLVQPLVTWTGNTVAFTWAASPGRNYRVQFKNTLSDPAWQTLGAEVTATNTLAAKADTMPSGILQRFYRGLWVNWPREHPRNQVQM